MTRFAEKTLTVALIAASLAIAACSSPGKKTSSNSGEPPASSPTNAAASGPSTRPVDRLRGRVVMVNQRLRYVVIDFTGSPLPAAEKRLALFRKGQKVAEIRVSGPARYNNITADVMTGEALEGDEAGER